MYSSWARGWWQGISLECTFLDIYLSWAFSSCCQVHSPNSNGFLDQAYDLVECFVHFETVLSRFGWPFLRLLLSLSFFLQSFSYQRCSIVFHRNLNDSKSSHVPMTFIRILADLNNAVVRMVSTWPLTTKSCCPFTCPLGISQVQQPQLVLTHLHISYFFQIISKVYVLFFISLSLIFTLSSADTA